MSVPRQSVSFRLRSTASLLSAVALAVTLAIVLLRAPAASLRGEVRSPFPDVPVTHPALNAIAHVSEMGIMTGYGDGNFGPDDYLKRVELAKIAVASGTDAELIAACTDKPFSDLQPGEWYMTFVCMARRQGYVSGYPDGTFRPDRYISAAEISKIFAIRFRLPLAAAPPSPEQWYAPYVNALLGINAIPPTVRTLNQQITRGEAAQMLSVLLMQQGGTNIGPLVKPNTPSSVAGGLPDAAEEIRRRLQEQIPLLQSSSPYLRPQPRFGSSAPPASSGMIRTSSASGGQASSSTLALTSSSRSASAAQQQGSSARQSQAGSAAGTWTVMAPGSDYRFADDLPFTTPRACGGQGIARYYVSRDARFIAYNASVVDRNTGTNIALGGRVLGMSRNGRFIAVAVRMYQLPNGHRGQDTVLYDVTTGMSVPLSLVSAYPEVIEDVGISDDGTLVAYVNHEREARLLNVQSQEDTLVSPGSRSTGIAMSADGRYLAYVDSPFLGYQYVVVKDRQSSDIPAVVNLLPDGGTITPLLVPYMTSDGRYTVFSEAFMYDRITGARLDVYSGPPVSYVADAIGPVSDDGVVRLLRGNRDLDGFDTTVDPWPVGINAYEGMLVNATERTVTPLTAVVYGVAQDRFWLSGNGRYVTYVVTQGSASDIYLYDRVTRERVNVTSSDCHAG